jgi:hypothetical protein
MPVAVTIAVAFPLVIAVPEKMQLAASPRFSGTSANGAADLSTDSLSPVKTASSASSS